MKVTDYEIKNIKQLNMTKRIIKETLHNGKEQYLVQSNFIPVVEALWTTDTVKMISVEGVSPTTETIQNGTYKVQRNFVFVTKKNAELSESAKPLSEVTLSKWDAVIIGNEGHGVSKEISEASDGGIYIPISSKTESLNASVAAAIFMWEQSKNF